MLQLLPLLTRLTSCLRKTANCQSTNLLAYCTLLLVGWSVSLDTTQASAHTRPAVSLKLVGTIINNQGGPSYALIKQGHLPIRFYSINDQLDGFKILSIHKSKISLGRNNQTYSLHLQQISNTAALSPTKSVNHLNNQNLPINLQIKRQQLKHISKNIQKWLYAVPLRLVFTDGRASGYQVENVRPLPVNGDIGLQKGDIIRAVNGVAVGQSSLFAKNLDSLMTSKDIYIKVERGHKIDILHFNVQD